MIYLTTGGNGAGKTLFTLWDVRQAQLKDPSRPVYYHGFNAKQPILDFGWLPFEPEKWQDLPDGSICIFDEAQNEMPAKIEGKLPEWINAIAQHRRRRGFDFWIITPHPTLININVRRLIESPSWHRHMKRTFGMDTVSQLTFNFAELKCEQPSSGARGQVEMRSYPKEVYSWYESATKHTGKKRIPKQVFVLAACLVAIPALGWFAWSSMSSRLNPAAEQQASAPRGVISSAPATGGDDSSSYLSDYRPRVPELPHTAPRYDEVTRPVIAPYPAACIQSTRGCRCYSQQGTRLALSDGLCEVIVRDGFFVDWDTTGKAPERDKEERAPLVDGPRQASVPAPAQPNAVRDGQALASMRNPT